jgi:A/G-specific adenine glycosylase
MLQQTQMSVVLPYYRKFLARFPSLHALARAPVGEVLKTWEGLGYYTRARNLHASACILVEQYGSRIPSDREHLLALPGTGPYTADAVLSIAFGEGTPVVDGNVRRIICRLFAIDSDPDSARSLSRIRELAAALLPAAGPGDFNQGLMHFGAEICTARRPECSSCPLAELCMARRRGLQHALPLRPTRRALPHHDVAAGVIRDDEGRVLIAQRTMEAMLGGMWEFPGGRCQAGESLADCLRRTVREKLALLVAVGEPLTSLRHAYSHFRMTLHALCCRLAGGEPQALGYADWRWAQVDDLSDYAFPVAHRKVIAWLQDNLSS